MVLMKFLISFLFFSLMHATPAWLTDLDQAKLDAASRHEAILLSFSGSDWCIPCIRLHKEIFDSEAFTSYASEHLVLVNADFPRLKKNQLSKEQTAKNEAMADQYNQKGTFPLTVLLSPEGKIIKQWQGYPNETPEQFINEIKEVIESNK